LDSTDELLYASKAYANDVALGVRTAKFSSGGDAMTRTVFPANNVKTGPAFDGASGYLNLDSGWAFATRGIEMLISRVIALGGKVMCGKTVTGLIRQDGRTRTSGVVLAGGSSIDARLVVIASGSWTASTFRDLDLDENKFVSTG
jgi:sarcosine oxidase/L-pipecolate oxidase